MFYPQTKLDNTILGNFKDIRNKYLFKLDQGIYIKKKNSIYPRLSTSTKRGKRSADEIIKDLCEGLITDPPFSIIYDIMKDIKISYEDGNYYSDSLLSFINLSKIKPKSNLQNILDLIKESDLTDSQLYEINKIVCSFLA